jgi:glycosyltransferase involved in cell wall biosynthesis
VKRWHILTPEFPPASGGVGDYAALLAAALSAEGDAVHIWHPAADPARGIPPVAESGESAAMALTVLPDRFGAASRRLMARAFVDAPGTVLVQYVPSAFGARGSNIPVCRWLLGLRRRGVDVRVMFHEPYFYFGFHRPWRNLLALSQRVMAAILLRASNEVYLSTGRWVEYLSPYGPLRHVQVLPIPATVPIPPPSSPLSEAVSGLQHPAGIVIGHFGTYGAHVATPLRRLLPLLLDALPSARVLLIGADGDAFIRGLGLTAPHAQRVHATGRISPVEIAAALRTCTVLVQPYPDGVTTRRTSLMACLTSGRPVVTSDGALTERLWRDTRAVALTPAGDEASMADAVVRLVDGESEAAALGARGRRLYDERFALEHTVATLRQSGAMAAVGDCVP